MTKLILDDWQKDVLKTEGNIVLRSGRQRGKSTIIAIKAAGYAANNDNKTVMIIASVERQAQLIFEKVLAQIHEKYEDMIVGRPSWSQVKLDNGSRIYCLPAGDDGYGIRGYTINMLIADEAAFIKERVWSAVSPMLAVTGGSIILLSTPFGKGGYFYRCFSDDSFTKFHGSSEDCPRIPKEFLEQEKERMSELEYAQEYLGEFVDELQQFFPTELIESCLTLDKETILPLSCKKYIGIDIAGGGRDDTVLFSLAKNQDLLYQIGMQVYKKNRTTDTTRAIQHADSIYQYTKIYLDSTGIGSGVYDQLREDKQTRRKTEGIENASRSLDPDDKEHGKLNKEIMYNNLLTLMELGKIKLMDDPDIERSLRSIQTERTENKKTRFFSRDNYGHITEALIRAAWCIKDKSLNIYFHSQ